MLDEDVLAGRCVSSSGAAAEISVKLKRGLLMYSCQIRQMVQGSRARPLARKRLFPDAVSWRRSPPGQSLLLMKRPSWS